MRKLYLPLINKGANFFTSSRRGAELIKYASNGFLATKITYINELANLCEKLNVNIEDVSLGIGSDSRIGGRFLRAGPAYGGSCFPKDTKGLVSAAERYETNLSIVKSVISSNQKRVKLLTNRAHKILGNKKGAKVSYYDPSGEKKIFSKIKNCIYKKNIKDNCKDSDLIILLTEWDEFKSIDFKKINKNKNLKIYDLRNLYDPNEMKKNKIKYYSIGRPDAN